MESAVFASGLSRQAAQVAPAALAPLVVAQAMSAATATTAAATIAHAASHSIFAAKVKLAGVIAASFAAVAVTAGVVVSQRQPTANANATPPANTGIAAPSPLWNPIVDSAGPTTTAAIRSASFSNLTMVPTYVSDTTQYSFGTDAAVRRTPTSDPAVFIAAITPQANGIGAQGMLAIGMPYRGKRVRISAYLKAKDVERAAALQSLVLGSGSRVAAMDAMGTPVVSGTTDWVRCSSVIDVPPDATQVQFAGALWGPGTVWMDGFEIEVVPTMVPTTSDGTWHAFTPFVGRYVAAQDGATSRDGHATVCMRSDDAVAGRRGEFGAYMRRLYTPDLAPFAGRRMRITAMVKADNVVGTAGLFATASQMGMSVAQSGRRDLPPPIKGSLGWMRYSTEVSVPEGTDAMELGIVLQGSGKVWIDDVKIELVDRPAVAQKIAPPSSTPRSRR
jgi:hypothetical protein